MPLSDSQIERYSRQIIVPRIGGKAQERLLTSRVLLIAAESDCERPLSYLAGAGVGQIQLAPSDPQSISQIDRDMRGLNPDVLTSLPSPGREAPDLIFVLIGEPSVLELARPIIEGLPRTPFVIARLDAHELIAIGPNPPPCPICVQAELLHPFGQRNPTAGIVAMAATVEAFRLAAGCAEDSRATLIKFEGLTSQSSELRANPRCLCATSN